jgi:hypothetical protein
MHPVKRHLNDLIEYFTLHAEAAQYRRQIDQRMFLLGIEIGRRRPLMPYERQAYLKTYFTALTLLVVDEATAKSRADEDAFKQAFAAATENWLQHSPVIGKWLETERKRCRLPDPSAPWRMDAQTRKLLVTYLEGVAADWPEILAPDEIDAFIERLEHPLDRA